MTVSSLLRSSSARMPVEASAFSATCTAQHRAKSQCTKHKRTKCKVCQPLRKAESTVPHAESTHRRRLQMKARKGQAGRFEHAKRETQTFRIGSLHINPRLLRLAMKVLRFLLHLI